MVNISNLIHKHNKQNALVKVFNEKELFKREWEKPNIPKPQKHVTLPRKAKRDIENAFLEFPVVVLEGDPSSIYSAAVHTARDWDGDVVWINGLQDEASFFLELKWCLNQSWLTNMMTDPPENVRIVIVSFGKQSFPAASLGKIYQVKQLSNREAVTTQG